MIDLTPLDVRKKKGDFRRGLRGYDAPQVDDFLDIVADRLESLVRENLALQERVARLENQVTDYREREKALTDALVTAQAMREEVRAQSAKEADAARREAENDAVRIRAEAQQVRDREEAVLRRLRGRQLEFLQTYRAFLERELAELMSTVRGLELNGTMGDALMTPPRLPDPMVESDAVGPTGAAAPVQTAPGGAGTLESVKDEWSTPVRPASPALALREEVPPLAEPERGDATAAADEWAVEPEPSRASADSDPPEPELILSDDDVLPDDDVGAAGVAADDIASDVAGGIAPAPPSQPPPARGSSTADTVGEAETELAPKMDLELESADPPRPAETVRVDDDLGLDLIPELDDVAELDDVGRENAVRPPFDAKAVDSAEPAERDAERSASKRRDVGDDTDNLLRSLFGDEH